MILHVENPFHFFLDIATLTTQESKKKVEIGATIFRPAIISNNRLIYKLKYKRYSIKAWGISYWTFECLKGG